MDGSTASDGTTSASDAGSPYERFRTATRPRIAKHKSATKRKKTYNVRKDEIRSLEQQLRSLQAKLRKVEQELPINKSGLRDSLYVNASLARAVEHSTLSLAGTTSMLSAQALAMIRATGAVPLKDEIHLPADPAQRHAVLAGLYDWKLHAAAQFMVERSRFLDLSVAQRHCEQFEQPHGAVTLDVTSFNQGHSLRQVYNALMSFIMNQEISLSEQLGMLTVRESDELQEELTMGESRFLSALPGGLEIEWNIVTFANCVDATPNTPGFAVVAMDFVDKDDLHPYRTDSCLRKELTGAITLHEVASSISEKRTIAMVRWSYVRVLTPAFELPDEATTAVRDGISQWCAYVPTTMKAQLAATRPAL